jgi:cation diffusion facilitator CzcD-associated flavoprotein CzcO
MSAHSVNTVDTVIVGSGFAGLGMAIRMKQAGMDDFVVLERAGEVGGTWRDNTYPGAACDVPSNLYSFSFAPNPNWSRTFSAQPEIQAYLEDCADRFGIRPHLRVNHEVKGCRWDETTHRWTVETSHGDFDARVVISATGALSEPALPRIPGIETFAGKTFHSSRWDHDHDLSGERVAVIGTGASAIQFVPQIQPRAGKLSLFQRTAPWVMPRWDRPFTRTERWMFRHVPFSQRLNRLGLYWGREGMAFGFAYNPKALKVAQRLAKRHLEQQVPDTALRAKLTPDYTMGCKRVLISNDYYPALNQPNVEVVTDGITEIRPHSVVTDGGPGPGGVPQLTEHPVDTIIFGTGFQVTEMPGAARIFGRRGESLREHWAGGMHAHKGTTVPGFPNLYLLVGPNTGLGHTSQVFMIEAQISYVLDALRQVRAGVAEVSETAEDAWNDKVQTAMARTVWTTGGCRSWYLDKNGRNTTLWPGFSFDFRRRLRRFDPAAYRVESGRTPAAVEDEVLTGVH